VLSGCKPQLKESTGRADEPSRVATHQLPDLDELLAELTQLERAERELSAARSRLHDRIDLGYPNELTIRRERQVSDERRALHRRIDALRAQLAPITRRPS
jgi:hypothetical protein